MLVQYYLVFLSMKNLKLEHVEGVMAYLEYLLKKRNEQKYVPIGLNAPLYVHWCVTVASKHLYESTGHNIFSFQYLWNCVVDWNIYSKISFIEYFLISGHKHSPLHGNRILDRLLALLKEYVRATRLRSECFFLT